jgi:hypothetical protein
MSDHLMNLVDGVVNGLSSLRNDATVQWMDDPAVELKDDILLSPIVWVVDYSTQTHDVGRVPIKDMKIVVIVQKKIMSSGDAAKQEVRDMLQFVSSIENFCLNNSIEVEGEEAFCIETNRERSRNLKEYNEKNLFYSEFIATYRMGDVI